MSSRTRGIGKVDMQRRLSRLGFVSIELRVRGITIHYVEGPRRGPTLLLIPGQSMIWDSYARALPLLVEHFHVVAVDVRGHGTSSWTPGEYDFPTMGADAAALLDEVAQGPAIISGNSSGGLIAMWVAANRPDLVAGIVMEDAPVFSSEWPRLRDDCYVYQVFEQVSRCLARPGKRDLAGFFAGLKVPVERGQRLWVLPRWLMEPLGWAAGVHEVLKPGEPVDLVFLPSTMRLLVRSLTSYDPQFSIAFLDGSACRDFDHAETLSRLCCPTMFLHADWFRVGGDGMLVGSADDADISRMRELVPALRYVRMRSGHMIHFYKPQDYVRELRSFTTGALTD
ncbi:MAG: alpha/beta hydrolase [Coriobacteriia bacterium]|nr:alpha/beta hydrolase [Coriobacteriia bacterium]